MKRVFAIAAVWIVLGAACGAEARWCSVTGIEGGRNLAYPPMARAARVYGIVLERVIYLPSGAVQGFEFISGPKMLSAGMQVQMKDWTITTNSFGNEACETLIIAEFHLDESSGDSLSNPIDTSVPSILRLSVSTTPVCLCDPAGDVTREPMLRRMIHGAEWAFRRVFPKGR